MANVYVRSGAAGAGTGADWANAYTTLSVALAAKAAGDDFWVSEDHSESTAGAITPTSPGTSATPCRIICVNHAGSVPPVSADLATTAVVATTGSSNITIGGMAYCYGISFTAGDSTGTAGIRWANACYWRHESCKFKLGGSNTANQFQIQNIGVRLFWKNCTLQFSSTAQNIGINGGVLEWTHTASAIAGATFPTSLISSSSYGTVYCFGLDLSALGAGVNLLNADTAALETTFEDCKLNASVTKIATLTLAYANRAVFIRCGSSGVNYQFEKTDYSGTETTETTIVRTGGASDGTTGVAKKIVTTANSKWYLPFEAIPINIWNDVSGSSRTVTIEGIWGGGAVPNNDDIWIDVGYLGSSGDPQASLATSNKADALAAGSAVSTSAASWGGSTTAFKLTATFTPQQKGPLVIRVKAAKASTTFYIDPKAAIS